MNEELIKIQTKAEQFHQKSADKIIPLYPGIDLCYLAFLSGSFTVQHEAMAHILQINIVKTIHSQLIQHMEQRITIEELSRQYLINPTTLKNAFKSVYGTSLASHIKEHRMKQAAKLLRESDMNIAEIAQAVGYDSQSKFTTAFKAYFNILPREYRKK